MWIPGFGDFQGTAGPRDADILSLPAHILRGSLGTVIHRLNSKMECPRPNSPFFIFAL